MAKGKRNNNNNNKVITSQASMEEGVLQLSGSWVNPLGYQYGVSGLYYSHDRNPATAAYTAMGLGVALGLGKPNCDELAEKLRTFNRQM